MDNQLDKLYAYQEGGRCRPHDHWEDASLAATIKSMFSGKLYGEITREGVESILSELSEFISPETVFYDIGSGYGTMVIHMAISTDIKNSIGIEFSKERWEYAELSIPKWEYKKNQPDFLCVDFFNHNFSNATLAYCDNTALGPETPRVLDRLPDGCVVVIRHTKGLDKYKWRTFSAGTTYGVPQAAWTIIGEDTDSEE